MSDYEIPKYRKVSDWLDMIKSGKVSLPRFQRGIVWNDNTIAEFIFALLKKRPVGVLLVLEYDVDKGNVPFDPHELKDAPEIDPTVCQEMILDGQQRLTALWRTITDSFITSQTKEQPRRFFIEVVDDNEDTYLVKNVICIPDSKKYSRIIQNPKEAFNKDLVPVNLLVEDNYPNKLYIADWCDKVFPENARESRRLELKIRQLSDIIKSRNIAYFSLPSETSREDAINAFIRTNESSSKVSRFDIAVAEIEVRRQEPLRDMIKNIHIDTQRINRFFGDDEDKRISEIGELTLRISCLLANKPPTDKHFVADEVVNIVTDKWKDIENALNWTLDFLEKESIFDKKRLPSVVPLRVVPALYILCVPPDTEPDKLAKFREVVRKYCWLSFVTNRYENQVNDRLWEDFKSISTEGIFNELTAPIFDKTEYPVPTKKQLSDLKHPLPPPTGRRALSRALLAISLINGAVDLASDEKIDENNIRDRQYHHLFPKAMLDDEGRDNSEINHPLNFALISDITNRKIAANPPVDYLKKRLKLNFDLNDIKRRVESHLIPFEKLNVESGTKQKYENFISTRAELFERVLSSLCKGKKL